MRVVFRPMAETDLEAIGDYIARDNPRRAVSFILELHAQCQTIGQQPLAAPLKPEYGEGVRQLPFGRYLILYTVAADLVIIEHIRHGAREPGRLN